MMVVVICFMCLNHGVDTCEHLELFAVKLKKLIVSNGNLKVQDKSPFGSGSGSHLPDSLKCMRGKKEEHNQNFRNLLSH